MRCIDVTAVTAVCQLQPKIFSYAAAYLPALIANLPVKFPLPSMPVIEGNAPCSLGWGCALPCALPVCMYGATADPAADIYTPVS